MCSLADLWRQCVQAPDDNVRWERLLESQLRLFSRIIARVANRFGANHAQEIDDAMQEICLKLSNQARLDRFPDTDDAMLEAYLKATIANAAHDYFRAQRAKRRDVTVTRPIDENFPMAAHATSATDADRRLLLSQIENLVAGSDRDKCIFFCITERGGRRRKSPTSPPWDWLQRVWRAWFLEWHRFCEQNWENLRDPKDFRRAERSWMLGAEMQRLP